MSIQRASARVSPSDRALAIGGNMYNMGDSTGISCARCVESAADKKATAESNAAWRTYSDFSTRLSEAVHTLLILQTPVEHPKHCIILQIHHQIRAPSEDLIVYECPIPNPSL